MVLRNPQTFDASSIAAISIEVWIGTYLKQGVNAHFADFALAEFTPSRIEALLSDQDEFLHVSENKEGIDGYVRISFGRDAPVAGCSDVEISTLHVQPRHHGKGIGTNLLNAALQHCRERSVKSVWLATNAQNDPAIAFYLAQGFEHVGQTQFRIGTEAYLNNVYRLSLR